jgi:hypothetical protein
MKKEAALSYRSGLTIAAALAVALGGALPNAASARDYKIGCANGACVIVDDSGRRSTETFSAGANSAATEYRMRRRIRRRRLRHHRRRRRRLGGADAFRRDFRRAGHENSGARPALRRREC